MRLQFEGSTQGALVPVLLTFPVSSAFTPATYTAKGYTKFDVLAIAASGGKGGDYGYTASPNVIFLGGGGGGGGSQRAQGNLADLDANTVVTVGVAGSSGANGGGVFTGNNATAATVGADGGPSSFGDVAQASGGKGGKVGTGSDPLTGGGLGGAGGFGGQTTAGGGGAGGTCPHGGPATAGTVGSWNGETGLGGGGGVGGTLTTDATLKIAASAGGIGNYSSSDASVADATPHGPFNDAAYSDLLVRAGVGGGAKAQPFTGVDTIYGSEISTLSPDLARGAGFVAVYLT